MGGKSTNVKHDPLVQGEMLQCFLTAFNNNFTIELFKHINSMLMHLAFIFYKH